MSEKTPDVNEPLTWPRDCWTHTRELRLGECVHGNGLAVCRECNERKNPLLYDADGLADMVKRMSNDVKQGAPGPDAPCTHAGCNIAIAHMISECGSPMAGCPGYRPRKAMRIGEVKEEPLKKISVEDAFKELCGEKEVADERELPSYTGYLDIDAFLEECLETMRVKGHDYRQGNDDDLLHNFRTVAQAVNSDMMKVWFTYFYKHYSAMATFIKEGGQSESEPIEGRIKDQIVYLLLFYRMVQETKTR